MKMAWCGTGKSGPSPRMYRRAAPAAALARATGIALRGFHSNSNNSTASSTAATGVANVADMPAGGARHQQRLSFGAVRRKSCAMTSRSRRPS